MRVIMVGTVDICGDIGDRSTLPLTVDGGVTPEVTSPYGQLIRT